MRIKGSICLLSFVFILTPLIVSAGNYRNDRSVAGHRVLKVLKDIQYDRQLLYLSGPMVIFQDNAETFWIALPFTLLSYDEKKDQWTIYSEKDEEMFPSSPRMICQDSSNRIWFYSGTLSAALYLESGRWHKLDASNQSRITGPISAIFTGKDGKLWSVSRDGLAVFEKDGWTTPISPPETVNRVYTNMQIRYGDDIGERVARIEKLREQLRGKENESKQTNSVSATSQVYFGLQDREGYIWLGTRKAILRFEQQKQEWIIYPLPEGLVSATIIYEDRRGRLWFTDEYGHVSVFDKEKEGWLFYNLKRYFPIAEPEIIGAIFQDKVGNMMFSTDSGLVTFSEKKGKWEIFTAENSALPSSFTTTIMQDRTGRIWVGTNKGIVVLEE